MKACLSPKWELESVGLDIRAERTHEKVQNESRSVSDWTIERSEGMRKSKMEVEEWRVGC